VTDHRDADLSAGGDSDAGVPGLVRNEVEDCQAPMAPATGPVTPEVVGAPPDRLRGQEPLAPPLQGPGHQTLRRLRPLERRREMTARPFFVRMRTRNP